MTPVLRFRVIHEKNIYLSIAMSYFAWNMDMSFLWYALIDAEEWP
jgi:hypothetical protein